MLRPPDKIGRIEREVAAERVEEGLYNSMA
jgi:hypothetical protein